MISETPGSAAIAVDRVNEALDALRKDLAPLENVMEAFRRVLSEKARLKAELPSQETDRHAAGVTAMSSASISVSAQSSRCSMWQPSDWFIWM